MNSEEISYDLPSRNNDTAKENIPEIEQEFPGEAVQQKENTPTDIPEAPSIEPEPSPKPIAISEAKSPELPDTLLEESKGIETAEQSNADSDNVPSSPMQVCETIEDDEKETIMEVEKETACEEAVKSPEEPSHIEENEPMESESISPEEKEKETVVQVPTENHFVECEDDKLNNDALIDENKPLESVEEGSTENVSKENEGDSGNDPEFVQVNTDAEERDGDDEKDADDKEETESDKDPIASDVFEQLNEDREGADEELCIIPDTERVISQAEREAAATIPPLRDIAEATTSDEASAPEEIAAPAYSKIIVHKYDQDKEQTCVVEDCQKEKKVKYCYRTTDDQSKYICDDDCLKKFKESRSDVGLAWEGNFRVINFQSTPEAEKETIIPVFVRFCASCKKETDDAENNLTWEIMDFCNELCLTRYQKEIGSHCSSCSCEVRLNSLGKYCVRFGNDIRQFCSSSCLEEYKKGLKVCSYCQQDISRGPEGFLAPVGDKGQFKDFCSQLCMEKYDIMTNDRAPVVDEGTKCSVCKKDKPITIEFLYQDVNNYLCSEPCFVAFCFVNSISPGKCAMCRRNFSKATLDRYKMFYDNTPYSFCSNSCQNIYIIAHRKIVPCSWCKVKKYNFDMIRRYSKNGPQINMCSVNCLNLYHVSVSAVSARKQPCHFCSKLANPLYHLTMSDATIRNFCSYNCVMTFQGQFTKQPIGLDVNEPVPTGGPKKTKRVSRIEENGQATEAMPVITSVQSLASNTNGNFGSRSARSSTSSPQILNSLTTPEQPAPFVQVKHHFLIRPPKRAEQRNVATMASVRKTTKSINVKPSTATKGIQTEEQIVTKMLIPIPVPIYVPAPLHMFAAPVPIALPIPIPVPVPIFIPTTRKSADGIMKEIKKIQVKIPSDPYEAEILMMAEMVAEEKKPDPSDSESDSDKTPIKSFSPVTVEPNNSFGDDMLQMALKLATELDEPAVDLEGTLTANTITAVPSVGESSNEESMVDDPQPIDHIPPPPPSRPRRRAKSGTKASKNNSFRPQFPYMPPGNAAVPPPPPPPEPVEKLDANMCLKYTYGVNAWKQWVTTKNAELEKTTRRVVPLKNEILQCTADELNYTLCLFVKEVRKPNGAEYAPDTIYYLCLGIQQYLFENGRIDNIFCDPYYEKFTECLDEVAKKFSVLYNDTHYIVTRVEEEHLWESKQLGAHSPHVLLSTLMFFNTKHFNLTNVDEHMQLSFSHIMKHWKRNPNLPGASRVPGSRNVLLRFYPPQHAIQNNAKKKKVYEQQENEDNPLRCPVKLYEFYLSKCPESVKTRNDVFYLQPERSCVPDSPVWYSTMPLPREGLEKMLHRVKMVKEINVALLTT